MPTQTQKMRQPRPRRLIRMAVRHDVLCGSPEYTKSWIEAARGRTLMVREGYSRSRRPQKFLVKLNWSFDPLLGLTIGAAGHAGEVSCETVPVTFAGRGRVFPRLDLSLRLGKDLEMLRLYYERANMVEMSTPVLPRVYAVFPGDAPDMGALKLNKRFIDDHLVRIANGTGALPMEQAPEALFAASAPQSRTVHVRYSDGMTDAWPFPEGTEILVPPAGCEVEAGQVIAHVVPRRGASAVRRLSQSLYQAACRSVVDSYCHLNVNGEVGYDLRLFDGPLPEGTRAYVQRKVSAQDACLCSPVRMIGRVGLVSFNFLNNLYDRRLPSVVTASKGKNVPLSSPVMGAA